MKEQIPYILLFLLSVFLSSVSQIFLKKAANRTHRSVWEEYTDKYVILGYGLFLLCSLLTMIAYQKIPLSLGTALETTGYLYVTLWGSLLFGEKITKKKILALGLIIFGILLYAC